MGVSELRAPIESARFRLLPLNRWQAFRLTWGWANDTAYMADYTGSSEPRTPLQWYREMVRPNRRNKFVYAIVPHGAEKPIGIHAAVLRPYRTCVLIVGIHDRDWWGRGVVKEVRTRIVDHVFANTDTERLYGQVQARNFASVFNYRTLGFAHVGTLHRTSIDKATGEVHDTLLFEMFREEWMARKEGRDG